MQNQHSNNDYPLVVDLDGTLINTDLLYEGFVLLLRKNPLYIFPCFLWLLKGKAYLKNQILSRVQIPAALLPYNAAVLQFLQEEHSKGRKLVLATASPLANAIDVANVHPVFSEVYGTTETINLRGKHKLAKLINEFGEKKFDYIGDCKPDLVIFASARYSYLVNPSGTTERSTKKVSELKQTWKQKKNPVKVYIKAIRAYQWIKNILIFVPLITSHSLSSIPLLTKAIGAFFAFSFVASAGYLINDLLDLNADRAHPRKQFRPMASGNMPILNGIILAAVLLAGGLILASQLSFLFFLIVLFYFITSFSYSMYLKRIVLYDVFILALLYSTRVFAGGIVTEVPLSFWLIAFSTFIFLSLAFVKRYSELAQVSGEKGLKSRGREYFPEDISLLQTMGVASGFMSVIVFSLYIDSPDVARLYSQPKILWAISLLFLFWISRIWLITIRGKMTDDPIIFALKDKTSYFIFLFVGIIILVSI